MTKYLAVLVWPVCMALIFCAALLMSRRVPATAQRQQPQPRSHAHHRSTEASGGSDTRSIVAGCVRLLIICGAGAIVVYGVMAALGLLVVHHGLAIDNPIHNWVLGHQVHHWASLMKRLTKIGDTWTCWGAAGAAAVCLAVTWRELRWLPPAVLAIAIVVDHYTTIALRHTFHRLGPPQSPFGTYPSGGCDRVILFYGLIAYLLWREFSRQRHTAIWAGAVVAALGVNEAYSRVYLSLHWFTDALSGLLYGCVLLAVFVTAIHLVAGGVQRRTAEAGTTAGDQGAVAAAAGGMPA